MAIQPIQRTKLLMTQITLKSTAVPRAICGHFGGSGVITRHGQHRTRDDMVAIQTLNDLLDLGTV